MLTVDDSVLKAVKVRAARLGKGDSELIEDALRSHLGLDLLDRIWATADMSDADAMDLAVEAQRG